MSSGDNSPNLMMCPQLLLLPVHHVDSDGVPLVLQLGAGAAAQAILPVRATHCCEESLSCNQEFVNMKRCLVYQA